MNKAKYRIAFYNNGLRQAQRALEYLIYTGKVYNNGLISYKELVECLFKNNPNLADFALNYYGKIVEEYFPSNVDIDKIYIDLTYQRVTDIVRCGEYVINRGAFDDFQAGAIKLFQRSEDVYVCTDGGHRIIMAILVGKLQIRGEIRVHDFAISLEEQRKREAEHFVFANDQQKEVTWDQIWKAKTIIGDDLALQFLDLLQRACLDIECSVENGATYSNGKKLFEHLFEGNNPFLRKDVPNYFGNFEADDIVFVSNVIIDASNLVIAGAGKEQMLTKDLEPFARLHYAKRTDSMPIGLSSDFDFVTLVEDWYSTHEMGDLTKGRKSNGYRAIVEDYIALGRLFNLTKTQKNKLKKLWSIDDA